MSNYEIRQTEFTALAVLAPQGGAVKPVCPSCFHAVIEYVVGDYRCSACYCGDAPPAHVEDARQPRWDVTRPAVKPATVKQAVAEEALAKVANATATLALGVICRVLQSANKAAQEDKPFVFPPDVIDTLLRVADRCDMLADRAVVREPASR